MRTHHVQEDLKKIEYVSPIDVAVLFSEKWIRYTLHHLFASHVDRFTNAQEDKDDYVDFVVQHEATAVINVEYSFIVNRLAELTDEPALFRDNFKTELGFDRKNQEYLIISLLEEYLKIVKMNSKKIYCQGKKEVNYMRSYFRPIVLEHESFNDDTVRFIQMNAVSFSSFEIKKLLDNDLFSDLLGCFSQTKVKQVADVFGKFQCDKFWKELGKPTEFYE